jgi:hypothetical protein
MTWVIAIAFTQTSCIFNFDDGIGCINGQGSIVTQNLNVSNFDGISLQMSAKVIIRQGNNFKVSAEGYANIIDRLSLNVQSGIWYIDTRNGCINNQGRLTITIEMPRLTTLRISSSGDITSDNIFVVNNNVSLVISGSGNIDLGLQALDLDSRISGSGNIFLEGSANNFYHQVSGSGDLKAFNFKTRRTETQISGSGNSEISVSENLTVRISGSGDVAYKGNPKIDSRISGSGRLINAN